jgi:putative restriction endonuclease
MTLRARRYRTFSHGWAFHPYWGGRCPLTGISDPPLLRASHIVPWAECDDDAQRLDVHNGLLLSALWDAAFDTGLVSFADNGALLIADALSVAARAAFGVSGESPEALVLTPAHRQHMRRHRVRHGLGADHVGS